MLLLSAAIPAQMNTDDTHLSMDSKLGFFFLAVVGEFFSPLPTNRQQKHIAASTFQAELQTFMEFRGLEDAIKKKKNQLLCQFERVWLHG